MAQIRFRRGRPEDAEELTALAIASKQHWGYSNTFIELWRADLEFTPASLRAHTVDVAEESGKLIGVFAISVSADTAELEALWVHPSRLHEGLGRALFERAVAAARAGGAARLVIASDPNASDFYIRMGASSAGSVPSKPPGRNLPRLIYSIDREPFA